jgi:diguanylate cyclase (GGDEF)-like protein
MLRTALAVLSMLVSAALIAGAASAQSLPLPATDLSTGGVDLTTGPEGVNVGVDAGDSGGVTVGAGPGGVDLGLRTTPKSSAPSNSAASPAERAPGERVSVPGVPTEDPRSGSSPGQSTPGAGRGGSIAVAPDAPGEAPAADRRRARGAAGSDVVDGLRPSATAAAEADREGKGGIAPVFDLVERIPAAVRAGLVALALIAIALWALWVRGRRRLEQNAYVDPDTGVANMEAFEQMLEREWQRATRYRRPLGLLLLDVEQSGAGGILLGERDARQAVADITKEVRGSDTVARLAQSRFAVICPEAPQGSVETLAHALELRLEERRLRCWAGFAERAEGHGRPADLVARAATALADAHAEVPAKQADAYPEHETVAFPVANDRVVAA